MNRSLPGSMFPDPEELARQQQADERRRVELAAYFQAVLFEPDLTDPREGATESSPRVRRE
jgi:hypothetical protein